MNIAIKFHREAGNYAISKVIKVKTIDELRETMLNIFTENNCDVVLYLWRDNGMCGTRLGDDGQEIWEHDMAKMADLVAKRIEEYGYCEIEGNFGKYEGIGVTDYDNEVFIANKEKGWVR
jgi:hypothetical protein